jgi:hypothetical protein
MKASAFSANSMVSGPTNSRCSGTVGNDRGGDGMQYFSLFIRVSRTLIRVRKPNSNWQIASLVTSGELAIEVSSAGIGQ